MYGFVNGYVIEEGVGAKKIGSVGCNLEGSRCPPHVTIRNQCSSEAGASGMASGSGLNQRSNLPSWKTFCKSKGIKIKTP